MVIIKKRIIYRRKRRVFRKRTFKRRPRLNVEKKHYDYAISQNALQTGSITLLSDITQGVSDSERVGTKAFLTTMFCHFIFKMNPLSTFDNIRCLIVLDKQGYNAPAVTDILEPANLASTLAPISQYNRSYMGRFRILYDKLITLCQGGKDTVEFRKILRVNAKAHYIGLGTTFMNQIYIVLAGDNGNILALPVCNAVFRLIYTDA